MKKMVTYFLSKIISKRQALRFAHSLVIHSGQSLEHYLSYGISSKLFNEKDVIWGSYKVSGIGDYGDAEHTGELFLIKDILPRIFKKKDPVIFDIGANTGEYCTLIKQHFPNSRIYAFEPNPKPFDALNRLDFKDVVKLNVGLGREKSVSQLYNYSSNTISSEHGSLLKEVFTDIHKNEDITSMTIQIDVLDDVCEHHSITSIDFLKIDTEGYEYEVLLGAQRMIKENRIRMIQLEFNEMNIVSKVFLRDFYHLLDSTFAFYRLKKDVLIPLGEYDSINEIFKYQNLVLIQKEEMKHIF